MTGDSAAPLPPGGAAPWATVGVTDGSWNVPGMPGAPLTGLTPGSRVAGYVLEQLIGVGGMATVYRAHDEKLGRVVALKLLAGDEALRTRFVREARAVAAVDHPHIIPVYAADEADGFQYIAMRFVPGDTLQGVIRANGPLLPRRAAALISPIAAALDAAHAVGLVHRDVKPGNILVDARRGGPEHPYLTDFGIAKAMLSAGGLTVGQLLGTPDYMAPEQIKGEPVDGRADQYALGCVAYEVLTGTVPFRQESEWAVLYAHLEQQPPSPAAARPGLPAGVDEVLATAMAKSPGDRYPSCGDFADALRAALGLDPYDPSRPPPAAGSATVLIENAGAAVAPTHPDTPSAPDGTSVPGAPSASAETGTWTALVTADRAHFDSVRPVDEQDIASVSFPGELPERRIPLFGPEIRIGRRSASKGTNPEIDLAGPPKDPGISRLHAKLVPAPDGTWTIVDLGTPNGIQVNGSDVPSGGSVPLRDGDRIHLGAWTRITITRDRPTPG